MSRHSSTPLSPSGRKWLFMGFFIFGMIFVIIGAIAVGKVMGSKLRCTEPVKGRVCDLIMTRSRSRKQGTKISYTPVFEYEYEGVTYKYTSPLSSSPAPFKPNQQVRIMVNPDDPEEIYVPDYRAGWIFGFVFAGVGLIFALIGIIGYIAAVISQKKKTA